jgi:general secretion pathway protein D
MTIHERAKMKKNKIAFWAVFFAFLIASSAACAAIGDRVDTAADGGKSSMAPAEPSNMGKAEAANIEEKPPLQETTTTKAKDIGKKKGEPVRDKAEKRPSLQTQEKPARPADKTGLEDKDNVMLNLEEVSLLEFSEVVFSELLKKNYEISPGLKDAPVKITIRMTKPVSRSQLFPLVREILKQYSIYVYEKEAILYLVPASELATIEPTFQYGKITPKVTDGTGLIYQIIPLDYINGMQLDQILRRFLSKNGTYFPFVESGIIIICDFPDRIQKILEILEVMDKKLFEDVIFQIVKPTYWEPSALVKQLGEILKAQSIPTFKPRELSRGVFLLPIDRLRELYIFSTSQEWLDKTLYFIENLDKQEALGGEVRMFTYFPTNTSAKDLGSVIGRIFGQTDTIPTVSGAQPPPAAGPRKLIVDDIRNALIFIVSPSEWASIKDLLERLDIPARQVLIEAMICELTLDDQFRMGLEWFMKNNIKINQKAFSGQGGTEGGLGLGSVGFLYTLVADNGLLRAAINAFISQNRITIISSPRIIGIDNKASTIRVGTEVPVVTSEAVTGQIQQQGTTGLLRSIQYRNTGVILTVTPTIHSGGVVALDINQEVSEAQTNTISPGIQSPMILTRSIQTSLIAKNGETIFIGGLISKNISSSKTGIPILSQIPLIGALFRSESKSERRTELIILITPHIMSGTSDLDYFSDEFRDKMLPMIQQIKIKEAKKDNNEKK